VWAPGEVLAIDWGSTGALHVFCAVRTPDTGKLTMLLAGEGASAQPEGGDLLTVTGMTADRISQIAYQHNILLRELTTQTPSLEDAFMELTADKADYLPGKNR
jgi:ABC-2 type transport system ATP-binding protein